jgi:hypothetical protein
MQVKKHTQTDALFFSKSALEQKQKMEVKKLLTLMFLELRERKLILIYKG